MELQMIKRKKKKLNKLLFGLKIDEYINIVYTI